MVESGENSAELFALDDDELWLRTCTRHFSQRGARLTSYLRPDDALEAIGQTHFALGMIDYHLGSGQTGAQFARRARDVLGSACPPLILVSSALERVPADERALFTGVYPKSTPMSALIDEVFATIAEAGKPALSSHSQLRAISGPVGRKRINTPT